MRAGRLNTRITLWVPGTGKDAAGRPVAAADTEVATVWAEKRHVSGKERWASEHVTHETTTAFRIRYREDISPSMVVTHKTDRYQITGEPIDPSGRREELIITCTLNPQGAS